MDPVDKDTKDPDVERADAQPQQAAPPQLWQKMVAWQDEVTHQGGSEEDTAWLVTYLDMLTLLLIWFVIMLAYSTFQPDKFTFLQESLSETTGKESTPAVKKADDAGTDVAERLAQRLARQLLESGLSDAVKMEVEDRRLTLQMQEQILFTSGHADLNEQGLKVLDRLAPALMAPGQMISVEGHTDNIPISTGAFPSNWELSVSRASRVVRYLTERGVAATRLRAIGYGETRPLADNSDERGRSVNRRVSIVIDLAVVGTASP